MSEPFLSEIKIVSFVQAPMGWALCNGQFLPINQNQALFSLLGTTYGGNGQTTFALPNLQGRVPIHFNTHTLGEAGTAADGAAVAVALEPDAILLDVGLPDRDGVQLAGELFALPWGPRILLTSSDPDATTPADAARHGACGFVRKHDLLGEGTDLLAGA